MPVLSSVAVDGKEGGGHRWSDWSALTTTRGNVVSPANDGARTSPSQPIRGRDRLTRLTRTRTNNSLTFTACLDGKLSYERGVLCKCVTVVLLQD